MSGTINKVILVGNVGKDPEVRHLENGGLVANFSMATSEQYLDKKTQEKKVVTDWHDIVTWNHTAEIVEKYVKKGYKLYVEGKLKKRSWQDKEGNTRYAIEVIADQLTILSRPEGMEKTPPSSYDTPPNNPLSPIDGIINREINSNDPF